MKILHVVRQYSPSVGGLEASVMSLASSQRTRLGHDARVVTLNRVFGTSQILPEEEVIAGVPVHRLPWRGSSRYPLAPGILKSLGDADVLHVHAIDFFFDFLSLTRFFHKRPIIASTHGGFFHTGAFTPLKKIWFATITRFSALGYQRIAACSNGDAELFRDVAGSRLRLIENGIDQQRLAGASSPVPTKTIICFGRFAEHKRLADVLKLLGALLRRDSGWKLILAGREAGQTTAQLAGIAEAEGVAAAVQIAEGPEDDALRELIGQASYFICLSGYEGFGLAAVEAMSAGLYPILSPIPPFRRFIENAGVGLIMDPAAPEQGADQVMETLLTDEQVYGLRRSRIAEAMRHYDWNEVAKEYLKLYDEAINTGAPNLAAPPGRGEGGA